MPVQNIRNLAEILRDEMTARDKITSQLRKGPKTIPEIADALKCPTYETTLWIMAMWRYGAIAETGKADAEGYFSYALKEECV